MSELIALAGDREIGRVRKEHGQLSFRYADGWLAGRTWHLPLSLSMPLAKPNLTRLRDELDKRAGRIMKSIQHT